MPLELKLMSRLGVPLHSTTLWCQLNPTLAHLEQMYSYMHGLGSRTLVPLFQEWQSFQGYYCAWEHVPLTLEAWVMLSNHCTLMLVVLSCVVGFQINSAAWQGLSLKGNGMVIGINARPGKTCCTCCHVLSENSILYVPAVALMFWLLLWTASRWKGQAEPAIARKHWVGSHTIYPRSKRLDLPRGFECVWCEQKVVLYLNVLMQHQVIGEGLPHFHKCT